LKHYEFKYVAIKSHTKSAVVWCHSGVRDD